jgi:hypothetical protein
MHNQFNNRGIKLFAKWKPGQDPICDDPAEIRWEDGKPASLDAYIRNLDETHEIKIINDQMVRIIFIGLVANVRFDREISRWVREAPDQPRVIMELSEHNLSDHQILAELHQYPLVYKAVIHRD